VGLLQKWAAEGALPQVAYSNLQTFVDLLIEWNQRVNLTGFKLRDEMEELLVGESILALKAFPLRGQRVLDFGSGAGVPGLIWAMSDPQIQVVSVEIRAKKIAFQKEVVRRTGISAKIIHGRFPEDVEGRQFDVIATRAIRLSSTLWDDAKNLLSDSGVMLRFASNRFSPEPGWSAIRLTDRTNLLVAHK
jgi:16S rRNA (guanine527-N7)-methyltransferase